MVSAIKLMAQTYTYSGIIKDIQTNAALENVELYHSNRGLLAMTNAAGEYRFEAETNTIAIAFFGEGYYLKENQDIRATENGAIFLEPILEKLNEVQLIARRSKVFALQRLKEFEGTSIYSGKKNEVILVDQTMANLASNNARQIYSQIPGLNIFQNDDAGIQLNIGGRGLDPNRTANFNTRQNSYDISADVLGYPESYYTPPAEALSKIQIIRGAASLQYGTQFGGLVNFILKQPPKTDSFSLLSRNTIGSNALFTNFTSISGKSGKLRYYSFVNHKKGSGFRDNSDFKATNLFLNLIYTPSKKMELDLEATHMTYLSKQAGGLNDIMFESDPFQSNRSRNWFGLDWFVYKLGVDYTFSEKKNLTFQFFGLHANRKALGFRVNRVDQPDSNNERDLILGDFNNFGFETKFLSAYRLGKKESVFVLGLKYYQSNNTNSQGPGSANSDADFNRYSNEFPYYPNQSDYRYPNLNIAFFGENIFTLTEKLSITPGFRLETINTKAIGSYRRIVQDAASNVILDETIRENSENKRFFVLTGLGLRYKQSNALEAYANASQNYRSTTFADISTINPAFAIDPNIKDESGYTIDAGIRGRINNILNYDTSFFLLSYNQRIGFIQKEFSDGNIKAYRTNTGNAAIYGVESLMDINLTPLLKNDLNYKWNVFLNTSLIQSEYLRSERPGIKGNAVEFVPKLNFKAGTRFGYKNITSYLQYAYISEQFSDSSNSIKSNLSGIVGQIPAYSILDFSAAYQGSGFKLEAGINNLLNTIYFTRRATGYPGPGIIPSPPRNYYLTLQIQL